MLEPMAGGIGRKTSSLWLVLRTLPSSFADWLLCRNDILRGLRTVVRGCLVYATLHGAPDNELMPAAYHNKAVSAYIMDNIIATYLT